jgi:Protein of unknown function DUF104
MALRIDASFEKGVFVPARAPALTDRERVRLLIEPATSASQDSTGSRRDEHLPERSILTGPGLAAALDFHPDGC